MKFSSLFIFSFLFIFPKLFSQEITIKEKKALKKELRSYLKEPIKYKYIKNNLEVKDVIIKEQLGELTDISNENKQLRFKLNSARDSIRVHQNYVFQNNQERQNDVSYKNDDGLKYRVQIGLYREFDISSFLSEIKVLRFEQIDGMFIYTLGNFKTEDEAEQFKEVIRRMGIKGAFVSYYLDGDRIPK